MPTYDYKCLKCSHTFERTSKIADRNEPCNKPCEKCGENRVEQAYNTAPAICDPIRIGVRKMDNGFKEVLQKVKEKTGQQVRSHFE
jgi:putative FmdB family regulatory protein